jgi:hypothetical protein
MREEHFNDPNADALESIFVLLASTSPILFHHAEYSESKNCICQPHLLYVAHYLVPSTLRHQNEEQEAGYRKAFKWEG